MDEQKSHFERVVCLRRWWLVKAGNDFNGKQLAVAGLSNREKEARRIFTSAPILTRYDDFNLETVDGISVRIHGFIDKARTEDNGFSSEIFQHFLFGFPAYWEECAKKFWSKESTDEFLTRNNTGTESVSLQAGGCLDSSNANKDQYVSEETVQKNYSFDGSSEKQDTNHEEATSEPNRQKRTNNSALELKNSESVKNDLTSAVERERITTADVNLCSREAEKKSTDVHEITPVNDKVPIVSPEAAATSGIKAASSEADEDVVPGCLDSSNADKDQYLSVETFQRNHSFANNLGNQDSKQGEATAAKPNQHIRMKKSAHSLKNSRSVKNDLTSAVKRKRSVTTDVNLSKREAKKKSAYMNESTPVRDTFTTVSPDTVATSGLEAASPQSERPWCDHCQKPGHTKAVCWEIHGKPANWNPTKLATGDHRGGGETTGGHRENTVVTQEAQKPSNFTMEQMEQIRHLLQPPPSKITGGASCSVAQIVSPDTVATSGLEAASPQSGYLDSSNVDKDQCLSVETAWRNHSSARFVEKQDAKKGEATAKPNRQKRMKKSAQTSRNTRSVKNDLTSAVKSKRSVTANVNLSRRDTEKKSPHVNESTPIHDTVPIVSPEATSFRRSRSGRLLLPVLDYWRNQRVVYDSDRKVVGVMGILDSEQLDKGSKSEPPQKRRNLQ